MEFVKGMADRVVGNVEKVIIGKRDVVELTILALLCQGHILIEDVPGTGKTILARAVARSIGSVPAISNSVRFSRRITRSRSDLVTSATVRSRAIPHFSTRSSAKRRDR